MAEAMISVEEARAMFAANFAPWVKDLGLEIEEVGRGFARCRVPANTRLNRSGGILSGQAMMAIADTAMVFAVRSALEFDADTVTVQQSTSFMRGVANTDFICEARVVKEGRTMMFGNCLMYADGQRDKPAAEATLVYAIVPRRG
ncbi:MAG: PaaI family thioesterase [Pseudomonadota bacterium]|nr:PaaI family thioesterase [Pseudomonadota bacterium]